MVYISIFSKTRSSGHISDRDKAITVSRHKSKIPDKKTLCITVGAGILKQMRWIKGDRIDIMVDDHDKTCLMKRVSKFGRKIVISRTGHGVITITGIPGDQPSEFKKIEHQIIDEEIIFDKCW